MQAFSLEERDEPHLSCQIPSELPVSQRDRSLAILGGAPAEPRAPGEAGTLSLVELASFFELSPDAIVAVRAGGHLAFANDAARAMFALPADVATVNVDDLLPERLRDRHAAARATYEAQPWRREMGAMRNLVARRVDGSELAVEVSLAPIRTTRETLTIAAVRDVSARRSGEARARQTSRLHSMLAEATDAMMHARTPAELFVRVCETASWNGGFLLAWVGLVHGDEIHVAAAAGPATRYLSELVRLEDLGPLPMAIREQQPVVYEVPASGPVAPWVEPFQLARARASCALPIARGHDAIGGLSLWSSEPGFFRGEHLALCEQLAVNLSHALDRLESAELHAEVARLGRLALSSSDLGALQDATVRSIASTLRASSCRLYEQGPEASSALVAVASPDEREPSDAGTVTRLAIEAHGVRYGEIDVTLPEARRLSGEQRSFLQNVTNIVAAALERARGEARLAHLAVHDPLTGMPNRRLLLERLRDAVDGTTDEAPEVAVLFVDLDRFKLVNDALGHSCGDHLLLDVARRLAEAVGSDQTVARIGGDEFAVLCRPVTHQGAADLAERIARALAAPFPIGSGATFVTASIGITLARPGASAEELLREADAAMYEAKQRGRDRYAFFDDEMRVKALRWLEVEAELRRALRCGELTAYYQPIYDLGGEVRALEALVRWMHPERGVVGPGEFIAIAEDTGLILDLGARLLDDVCAQLAEWQLEAPLQGLPVALNVSGVQLADPSLPDLVEAALVRHSLPASCLQVEVTETALMHDTTGATRALQALRDIGVQTAIDDFGTGYSSLHYLRHLPVDAIKIDRSFIAGIHRSDVDLAIVRSVLGLAKVLGLRTVAEGVERPEQLDVLRQLGCDLGQGFLWAPALSSSELQRLLAPDEAGATGPGGA